MKLLVDCGFSNGCFSRRILNRQKALGEDLSTWRVYGFEPNSEFYADKWDEFRRDFPEVTADIQPVAAWVEDEKVRYNFCISKASNFVAGVKFSSLPSGRKSFKMIPAIDLTKWLEGIASGYTHFVLKMDIEGAEFYVLPKLQASYVCRLLDEVYVEYHERVNPAAFKPIKRQLLDWWAAHSNIKHTKWR